MKNTCTLDRLRPRALDLFCGAGGAAAGLMQAGFSVLGVDISEQPNFPRIQGSEFRCDDALNFPAVEMARFDLIWASPPCQRYSVASRRFGRSSEHPDLVARIRARLKGVGVPYVIENVPGAPLNGPMMLCGSMFNLRLRRHRLFETSFCLGAPRSCRHVRGVVRVHGHPGGSSKRDGVKFGTLADWRCAMRISWMTATELAQAIPPAYARYIGAEFLRNPGRHGVTR